MVEKTVFQTSVKNLDYPVITVCNGGGGIILLTKKLVCPVDREGTIGRTVFIFKFVEKSPAVHLSTLPSSHYRQANQLG
jgi:hypothetical protein